MGYTDRISASVEDLHSQAYLTAEDYLYQAVSRIDKRLGDGYAKQHPELIAAFMQTAATDFRTAVWAKAFDDLAEVVNRLGELTVRLDNADEFMRPPVPNATETAQYLASVRATRHEE